MNQNELDAVENSHFDVVICGDGLAGLLLGLQMRRDFPQLRTLILEKTARPLPDGCHKVGESSVELGCQYLESLGLRDYLLKHQLVKHGLRFFPGGGHKPIEERFEIGPMQEPIVSSYQLDRGSFENDLRGMNEERGTHLIEGAIVRNAELTDGSAPHTITFETKSEQGPRTTQVKAKWIVDATGRHALLRKRMKLTRGSRHAANAGWYRVEGRVDINEMVPKDVARWHDHAHAKDRWRSTNHFMGPGYWLWIIPLSSGMTSIGVVVHNELHPFDTVRSLERVQEFITKHEPVVGKALEPFKVLDFLCLKDYSHTIGRGWSTERWAMVGEAGAFVDPLYSPGTDFIAYANTFTGELIRTDLEGGDLETRTRELNLQYRALVAGNIDVYAQAAPVYGHPRGMLAKVYWDNLAYWSYSCQYFLRGIWKLSGADAMPFLEIGQRTVELSNYIQGLLREWALIAPEEPVGESAAMPRFPSVLVDAHIALRDDMTPAQTLDYMRMRIAQAEEVAGELLVRIVGELNEEDGALLVKRANVARWRLAIDPERLTIEPSVGLARRHALSPIARDVERSLGRSRRQASEATLRTLLAPLLRPASALAAEPPHVPEQNALEQSAE
ncbi:MAG: FAD-dependent monooxygenase [Polyangiales bacterium]